ncbi:tail fiber domain-containing protein [Spirosoma koreense]
MKNGLFSKIVGTALFAAMLFASSFVWAQVKVGDNPTTINANSALEVESTNKGLLLPRLPLTQTTSPTPLTAHVAGMTVYNTATANDVVPGFYYNDGTKWVATVGASADPNYNYTYGSGAPTGSCNSGDLYTDTLETSPTVGQQFVCSGGSWVSYTAPNRTEFYINGTTNDAGGNKGALISRNNGIWLKNPSLPMSTYLIANGGIRLFRSSSLPAANAPLTNGYIDFTNSSSDPNPMRIAMRSDPAIGDLAITIQDHGTPRMTVTQAGLVGVGRYPGTTFGAFGPARMEVQGVVRAMSDGGFPGFYPIMANNDPDLQPVVIGLRSRGTIDAPTFVQSGDNMGLLAFRDHQNHGSQILVEATQNHTAAAAGTNLSFWTIPNNGTVTTRRMTIDHDGQVGINTPAPFAMLHVNGTIRAVAAAYTGQLYNGNSSQDGAELYSGGGDAYIAVQRDAGANLYLTKTNVSVGDRFAVFGVNSAVVGSITRIASGISYNTSSDIRLKENIKVTRYGLSDLMKIKVADYNYKSDKKKTQTTGFLAQDLYKAYPVAVTIGGKDEKTNPWTVDYGKVTPLIVKAVQEQQEQLEALKAENTRLKAQVAEMAALKAEVASIKSLLGVSPATTKRVVRK